MGCHRWVIERTLAWFARFQRLTVRYERCLNILLAFHLLAAGLICLRFVER
jgi:transposase